MNKGIIAALALAVLSTQTAMAEPIETQFGVVERDISAAVSTVDMPALALMRDIRVAAISFYAYPHESEKFIRAYGKQRALSLCRTKKVKLMMDVMSSANGMYVVTQSYNCKGKVQ